MATEFKTQLVLSPGKTISLHAPAMLGRLDALTLPSEESANFSKGWWWTLAVHDADYEMWAPVAYCGLHREYRDRGGLSRAAVLPDWRGKGLQRRMIRLRERKARTLNMSRLLTYTAWNNAVSSNNLIATGYRLYEPHDATRRDGWLHWFKDL